MPKGGLNTLGVRLFHSVDNNSTKADKYAEHGTAIAKLVSQVVRGILAKLAAEDA